MTSSGKSNWTSGISSESFHCSFEILQSKSHFSLKTVSLKSKVNGPRGRKWTVLKVCELKQFPSLMTVHSFFQILLKTVHFSVYRQERFTVLSDRTIGSQLGSDWWISNRSCKAKIGFGLCKKENWDFIKMHSLFLISDSWLDSEPGFYTSIWEILHAYYCK